jgi:hypothetical protein
VAVALFAGAIVAGCTAAPGPASPTAVGVAVDGGDDASAAASVDADTADATDTADAAADQLAGNGDNGDNGSEAPLPCPDCVTTTALSALHVSAAGAVSALPGGLPSGAFVRLSLPKGGQSSPCWSVGPEAQQPTPGYVVVELDAAGAPDLALVECHTGLPPSLVVGTDLAVELPPHVDVAWAQAAALGEPSLKVRVHVLADAWSPATASAHVAAAVQHAVAAWQAAGIALDVDLLPSTVTTGGELVWTPHGAALHAMLQQLGEAQGPTQPGVAVVVAPCLRRANPALQSSQLLSGSVLRIPGGLPLAGMADGVFVATGACPSDQPATAEQLGWRLAHELGHWLGLRHPVEATGATDNLADTDGGKANLMTREEGLKPSFALTPLQAVAARRHPALQAAH